MTKLNPQVHERHFFKRFATRHSAREFRGPMGWAYAAFHRLNHAHFAGRLTEPHFVFLPTPSKSLGYCRRTTGHGAAWEILFSEGLFLNHSADWVRNPGGEGHLRFNDDLLLKYMNRQFVLEVHGGKAANDDERRKVEERGYGGYGPLFAEKASSISIELGLQNVVARRRPTDLIREYVSSGWPFNVRGRLYYGADITDELYDLAAGQPESVRPSPASAAPEFLELLEFLLIHNRVADALAMLARRREWVAMLETARWRSRPEVEAGIEGVDGKPLGEVRLDPACLSWHGGLVRRMLRRIVEDRTYGDLPILADALEETSVTDDRILLHLRERMPHSRRCWVVRLLLALGEE